MTETTITSLVRKNIFSNFGDRFLKIMLELLNNLLI